MSCMYKLLCEQWIYSIALIWEETGETLVTHICCDGCDWRINSGDIKSELTKTSNQRGDATQKKSERDRRREGKTIAWIYHTRLKHEMSNARVSESIRRWNGCFSLFISQCFPFVYLWANRKIDWACLRANLSKL